MGKTTGIPWTHHTFNAIWGCEEVSPACLHCYAREWAARFGYQWGADAPRRTFGDKHWAEPLAYNAQAYRDGVRRRIFGDSMSDWMEDHPAWRTELPRLWNLIRATPWLDWLMLTKRPERWPDCWPITHGSYELFDNLWVGVTVENYRHGRPRLEPLRQMPAGVKFLSMEPLLNSVTLRELECLTWINWVIVGGESEAKTKARRFDLAWAITLVEECRDKGIPVFVKQLGSNPVYRNRPVVLKNRKGEDPSEWPAELRVQEFPQSAAIRPTLLPGWNHATTTDQKTLPYSG